MPQSEPVHPLVTLRKPLERSLRRGHPWIFRDALHPAPEIADGAMVAVRSATGRPPMAWGYWTASGPIAVRVLDLAPVPSTRDLVTTRLRDALAQRLSRLDRTRTNAFRWIHGEGDRLPGIHLDLYDRVATVRYDGVGARAFYEGHPEAVIAAASAHDWVLETVVDRDRRHGVAANEILENGLRFAVDLAHGQKGGLFLDQRDNRAEIGRRAAGKSVLNLFGYTGAFSVYAAAGGARRTDTVDLARPAVEAARHNFTLNNLSLDAAGFHAADAFEFLAASARRGDRWDLVISDPPSFAPSKRALPAARSAYRRLHRLAAAVVAKGGLFCPASCSSHFPREEFLASVTDGTRQASRRFSLEEVRGAGFDHPVLPAFPEGNYLKFAIGRLD